MHPGDKCEQLEPKESHLEPGVVRRLLNTSSELPQREKDDVIKKFILKLKKSGYSFIQMRDIIISGLIGYKRKWANLPERHRTSRETEDMRRHKKLTGKTLWFKRQKKTIETERTRPKDRRHTDRQTPDSQEQETDPSSVLFVERTEGGGH